MRARPLRVLLVEDDDAHAELVCYWLRREKAFRFEFARALRLSDAFRQLEEPNHDLVLLDLDLPDSSLSDTLDALPDLRAKGGVPLIVLTSLDDPETYQRVVRKGATACVSKMDFASGKLTGAVRQAVAEAVGQ